MVDFRFDIKSLFPQPIVKVTSNLLPHTFRGDRRQALDATSKMSEIIDRLGQLSAASQKLTIPITTGQRLRQSENQTIYLLADTEVEPRGAAVGLLKVGKKDLYLFDESGQTRKVESSPCILDFYIHESRQRAGLGKELFETMLAEEGWKPVNCSIDRPSEKLIAFMRKHYGLERTIRQANNFVLFEGYFDDLNGGKSGAKQANGLHLTNSPNTQLFGAPHLGDDNRRHRSRQPDIVSQVTQVAPAGRYGARRPVCSMAQRSEINYINASMKANPPTEASSLASTAHNTIIHQVGAPDKQDTNTHSRSSADDDIVSITTELQKLDTKKIANEADISADVTDEPAEDAQSTTSVMGDDDVDPDPLGEGTNDVNANIRGANGSPPAAGDNGRLSGTKTPDSLLSSMRKPSTFHLSKQHTGMKNISFGVGMAVTPSNKMEFDQEAREDFGVVKINRPIGKLKSPPAQDADAMSTVSSSAEGLTDQGYYDLKFYHNKLW